ncbi:hypothetical protein PHBOTO_006492 [Pseudozyma hubeiensis]|nr:hypothetical protein PHBOTO_006492 [Pseudozyma hubeiensis]
MSVPLAKLFITVSDIFNPTAVHSLLRRYRRFGGPLWRRLHPFAHPWARASGRVSSPTLCASSSLSSVV